MVSIHSTGEGEHPQGAAALAAIIDRVDASELVGRLQEYQFAGGPKGYPLVALWRAHLASYILNLPSTNALIRLLQDDAELRLLCGFSTLPHRRTFNRFIKRLDSHTDLVERCIAAVTDQLADLLPGLGEKVAVDSTTVRSHSNPNRKSKVTGQVSDPDASWTAKNSARAKGEKEWSWGYKLHLVVDATYGVPLGGHTTTASRHDGPELPSLLDRVRSAHPWAKLGYVIADKGYDGRANHEVVVARGGVLICPARRSRKGTLYEGIYTEKGVPTCMGMVEMEYVRSDPEKGHLYRCRRAGCRLKTRRGALHHKCRLNHNSQF